MDSVRFARKTKSGFCACAITFQLACNNKKLQCKKESWVSMSFVPAVGQFINKNVCRITTFRPTTDRLYDGGTVLYYIKLYYIISYIISSQHITPYHITSHIPYHITYHITYIISYHIIYHIIYHITSRHITSHHISYVIIHMSYIISYLIISHIISYYSNTIVLQLPTVFSTVTCCTGL